MSTLRQQFIEADATYEKACRDKDQATLNRNALLATIHAKFTQEQLAEEKNWMIEEAKLQNAGGTLAYYTIYNACSEIGFVITYHTTHSKFSITIPWAQLEAV